MATHKVAVFSLSSTQMEELEEVREQIGTLEALLGQFIVQTTKMMNRMDRDAKRAEQERVALALRVEERTDALQQQISERDESYLSRLEAQTEAFEKQIAQEKQVQLERQEAFNAQISQEKKVRLERQEAFKQELAARKNEFSEEQCQMNKRWGEIANRIGTFAEDIAAPNVLQLAREEYGCENIMPYDPRLTKQHPTDRSREQEYDVIVVSDDYLFLCEAKINPRPQHVDEFLALAAEVTAFYPEYPNREVVPIFSALLLPDKLGKHLTRKKVFGLAMGSETMEVLHYEAVRRKRDRGSA